MSRVFFGKLDLSGATIQGHSPDMGSIAVSRHTPQRAPYEEVSLKGAPSKLEPPRV